MNVYAFEVGGETDWICARTMVEAIKFYENIIQPISDLDNSDEIFILSESDLDKNRVKYPDEEPEEDGSISSKSFREAIEGCVEPSLIASTCY